VQQATLPTYGKHNASKLDIVFCNKMFFLRKAVAFFLMLDLNTSDFPLLTITTNAGDVAAENFEFWLWVLVMTMDKLLLLCRSKTRD
jgi:hypothetical protein